jgi:hypothetical protein
MPPLVPISPGHVLACHNPATGEEALAGHPLRAGFERASEPAQVIERA